MNAAAGQILVLDDDPDVLLAARLLLKQHGYRVRTETDPRLLPALLKAEAFDVVLLDMNFTQDASSGREGFYWLREVRSLEPGAVVVLITAYGDVEMAVRAIKEGATDFVLKPWQNEKLLATLSAALHLRRSRQEALHLRSRQQQLSADLARPFDQFVGQAPAMQQVFGTLQKVAPTDANVLILGENGTGKELVARELHRQSPRAGEVFLSVDMGSLSESLFESELFGHVKGAFTDARADRAGRFEIASGGTLFLDEIGNLPLSLQAKLLSALQSRTVTPLGSNRSVPVDVRLICATNRPIHELVGRELFRQDLLYRINTVEIHLPPLRERREDIPLLVDHYLEVYAKKYGKAPRRLSAQALRKLESYSWPGNIRELQHAVERALILSEGEALEPGDFLLTPPEGQAGPSLVLESYALEAVEKEAIRKVLHKHQGNVSQAARELGLTRTALYRRIAKYEL
ncbi:MAG: sigma-54-dependent Fis family transcriptional regulator [Candidatus Latescibacteria bacterium]|nr:sigma-54-dependent Fis family transcriptional regulator [Candidatus Latescibacterota bacterium]